MIGVPFAERQQVIIEKNRYGQSVFFFLLQTRHTKNINVTVKFRTCVKRKTWNAVPCSVQGNKLSKN